MNIKNFELNDELYRDFIQGWYIEESLCDDIFKFLKENIKNKDISWIAIEERGYSAINLDKFEKNIHDSYIKQLFLFFDLYKKQYGDIEYYKPLKITNPIHVQYWEPFKFYSKPHFECSPQNLYRQMVFITYLNDVTDAGETHFIHNDIKINPKKGLTIFFPAGWTHYHKGIQTPQEKGIITGWVEFLPSFNRERYYYEEDYVEESISASYE